MIVYIQGSFSGVTLAVGKLMKKTTRNWAIIKSAFYNTFDVREREVRAWPVT